MLIDVIITRPDMLGPSNDKAFGMAALAKSTYSLKRLEEEIAKCDVVCSNCHRIRTQLTYGSYRIKGHGVPANQ